VGSGRAEIDIAKAPEEVWAVVGDFGGIGSWMPGLESCVVDGDDRLLKMMGLDIRVGLECRDDDRRILVYAIVGGVPVQNHRATISVESSAAGSRVLWDVDVEPDEMTDLMKQTYQGALEALKQHLGA
jgi:carbon monoxide dehydrogenase subunit G